MDKQLKKMALVKKEPLVLSEAQSEAAHEQAAQDRAAYDQCVQAQEQAS